MTQPFYFVCQVCGLAEHVGVGVHFNALVPMDGQV